MQDKIEALDAVIGSRRQAQPEHAFTLSRAE
jgi:hypothetical protein